MQKTILNKKKNEAWYREQANIIDSKREIYSRTGSWVDNPYKRMKINYDLCNNILNADDFQYVIKPYGQENFESLPANFSHKDFITTKIKVLLGMEESSPFSWNIISTNPSAIQRKEKVKFDLLRDYVVSEIMGPIRQDIEMRKMEEAEGRELTEEEVAQIQQEIEEELNAMTPQEIKRYMERDHKDASEILASNLLNYLLQKTDFKHKMLKGLEHALKSSVNVYYIGIVRGEPELFNVNPLDFTFDRTPESGFIEDGDWARCEYRMNFSEIISKFGDELSKKDLENLALHQGEFNYRFDSEDLFDDRLQNEYRDSYGSFTVVHTVWKDLRKIGFLKYLDEEGKIQERQVDEDYELNEDFGDISISYEMFPECYETWIIKTADPIYVRMRPVPGQFKDLSNLHVCKLPYYGLVYDSQNSTPVSLVDRLKPFNYLYDIVWFRLEGIIASDKGKKILMNINSIPSGMGISLEKWKHYFENSPFMFYNPDEEGLHQSSDTVAKVMDLSLASDIQKYIEVLEYIKRQAGISIGITDQVEGQISHNDPVNNAKQNLVQSSYILKQYFYLHNTVKKNVLTALLETAKVAYSVDTTNKKLSYMLDDVSMAMFEIDPELLDDSTYGLFVNNSIEVEEVKDEIKYLAQAAMQNDKITLSDLISTMRQKSVVEMSEVLKAAENEREEAAAAAQQRQIEAEEKARQEERDLKEVEHEREIEKIITKEEERRKTVIVGNSLMGMSFNPDLDQNRNGINDFIEIARHGLERDIKISKSNLEREKFEHQKKMDEQNQKNTEEKLANEKKKIAKMMKK